MQVASAVVRVTLFQVMAATSSGVPTGNARVRVRARMEFFVVDDTGDELWGVRDPTDPGTAFNYGEFPAGIKPRRGASRLT